MGSPADVRLSFNEAAETYHRVRPSYPAALFDQLFRLLPAEPEIVEAGPGTGQATKDLLGRGARVHAVEIGPAMASVLRANLPTDRLRVTVGDFELVDIAPGSADAVFSATAYHWISPAAQLDRPAALLRPGGVLAVVDLVQVDSPEDAGFFAAAQPVYERYGQGHTGPPAPSRNNVQPEIRRLLDAEECALRVDRRAPLRLESALQRGRVPAIDGVVLGDADDGGIRPPGTARRHGTVHPRRVRRTRHPSVGRHADHRDAVVGLDRRRVEPVESGAVVAPTRGFDTLNPRRSVGFRSGVAVRKRPRMAGWGS